MPTRSLPIGVATASDPGPLPRAAGLIAFALLVVGAAGHVAAADAPKSTIYQCELNGKRVTSDRPIPECINKDQRQLNPDGSLKQIVKPTPTPDEIEASEVRDREAKAALAAQNDAVRRDRNLMQRFPNEAAHQKARAKALDDVRAAAKNSESRIAILTVERKKLEDEKQFYVNDRVNKSLPLSLKQKLDANEAALEAQKSLAQNQDAELARINRIYDVELKRLDALWKGAQPGSLGPVPQADGAPIAVQTGLKTSAR